jgi:hypothetical protein
VLNRKRSFPDEHSDLTWNKDEEDKVMKIVHCPKGGRIPKGYCEASCLNFSAIYQDESRKKDQGSKQKEPCADSKGPLRAAEA